MENEDKEEDRRQRSDEARRAAMRQKIQQKKDRDRQIAIDIANVDQKATKRIVFDDSDDNDEVEKITENGKKKSSVNGSKRPKLFDSEGEDEDENGSEIEIKNRHSGPKGEQLMKLESRFNSDPRFKLDDKFAESESDDEDGNEPQDAEKKEMKMEKDKNRELLSKILGKSIEEKKPKSAEATALKARPFTRFDPENPEHLAWMKEFEASKNPQKRMNESKNEDSEDEEKDDENTEEVGKEKGEKEEKEENSDNDNYEKAEMYFKMDDKFSAEMKGRNDSGETSNAGFSFLSMIGRNYENGPKEEDEDEKEKPVEFNKKKETRMENVEQVGKAILKVKVTTKFFIDPLADEKIRSMAANFRRTQTVEKIIDKWAPHRDAIFKLWKKQRRDAVKKRKESFFTNGKRKRKAETDNEETTTIA